MKIAISTLLGLLSASAFGQGIISDRIPDHNRGPADGFVYQDSRRLTDYTFEIHFRLDPAKFDSSQQFSCNGRPPDGYTLFDRFPTNEDGRWMIAIGGNSQLCYLDEPRYSWGPYRFTAQLPVQVGTCHELTAVREVSGRLTITLDDSIVRVVNEWDGPVFYRAGRNGIGVGREVNGYHEWQRWDTFPGEISYVEDNGVVIDFVTGGRLTGNAYLGPSECGSNPPPLPPPEPTACELDPNSVECACENNPHPACNLCLTE